MDHVPEAFWRGVYVVGAAAAGALTAVGAAKWRDMSRIEVGLTLITGFTFAIFVTPWIAHEWLGIPETNYRAIAGLTYVFGSASNILLPLIIGRLRKLLGVGENA